MKPSDLEISKLCNGVLTTLVLIGRLSAQKWTRKLPSSARMTNERRTRERITSERDRLRLFTMRTVQSGEEGEGSAKDMVVEEEKN